MVLRAFVALLLAALLTGPMWVLAGPTNACVCTPTTFEEDVARADLIVVGVAGASIETPVDERVFSPAIPVSSSIKEFDLAFRVERYIKGSGPAEIIFRHSLFDCDFFGRRSVGREYLVFVHMRDDGLLIAGTCDPSTGIIEESLPRASLTIERIRNMVPPQSEEPLPDPIEEIAPPLVPEGEESLPISTEDRSSDTLVWATVGGALGALAFGAGLFALRWRGARR